MAGRAMKKPASLFKHPSSSSNNKGWQPPKRGKERAVRRPIGRKVLKKPERKYTRRSSKGKPVSQWCIDIPTIMQSQERALFRTIRSIGLLPRTKTCPKCGSRILPNKHDMQLQGRCAQRDCQKRISWFEGHPFLANGGRSIRLKLSLLLNILMSTTQRTSTIQYSLPRSGVQLMLGAIRNHIASHVGEHHVWRPR